MNEEARESSVVGDAINLAVVGAGVYGAHKGLTSGTAYNWAHNTATNDNFAKRGVRMYNDKVKEAKEQILRNRQQMSNNTGFVDADFTVANDIVPNTSKRANAGNQPLLLKEGLSGQTLKNQQELDALRNGMQRRRAGGMKSKFTDKSRRKIKTYKGKSTSELMEKIGTIAKKL